VSFVNEASHFLHKRPLIPKHNRSGSNGPKWIEVKINGPKRLNEPK